jgi:hypothetical protein
MSRKCCENALASANGCSKRWSLVQAQESNPTMSGSRDSNINVPVPLNNIHHQGPKMPTFVCQNQIGGLYDKPDSHANP